jgi:hypothetical protein
MIALLGVLLGPLRGYLFAGLGVVALGGAAWGVLAMHDSAVRAQLVAQQQAAAAAAQADLHQRAVAAFGRLMVTQQAEAQRNDAIAKEVDRAPSTDACLNIPAVNALLRLRGGASAGTGGAAAGPAAPAAGVQPRAGAATPAVRR